jgi:hypothetical protein
MINQEEYFKDLSVRAHANAKEKGFHDEPMSNDRMVILFNEELMEMHAEIRNGKPDFYIEAEILDEESGVVFIEIEYSAKAYILREKNSHEALYRTLHEYKPEGVLVELADYVIRVADAYGAGYIEKEKINFLGTYQWVKNDSFLRSVIGGFMTAEDSEGNKTPQYFLLPYIDENLRDIIEAKMLYNTTRAHKHGKRF